MPEEFSPADAASDAADAALAQATATTALAVQVGELAEVIREMRTTSDRVDRRGRWTSRVSVVVVALIGAGMAITYSGVNERNDRADQSRVILEAIQANQETIKACTSPGHPCYDENQQRSNARLAPIIAVLCDALPPEKRRPPCPAP